MMSDGPSDTRILVVDDEADLCAQIAEFLAQHGYLVQTAS